MTTPIGEGSTGVPMPRDFPSTCWSRILDRPRVAPGGDASAFQDLAKRYWKPIYAYLRVSRRQSHDDARDLTQEFFVWMMESDFLGKADPQRGKFRAFVQVALKHFVVNHERSRHREKRGGGRDVLTLGEIVDWGLEDAAGRTPEEELDRVWKAELLLRAADQLQREYERDGRSAAFEIFRDFHLDTGTERPAYRALAEKHGVNEKSVANTLNRVKERYREIVTDLVAETVTDAEMLREELNQLFGKNLQ